MRRRGAPSALARLVFGLLMVGVSACATPQPSATTALPTAAPSATVTASPSPSPTPTPTPARTPSPTAVAGQPTVVCDPESSIWTETDANGSEVPIRITLTCKSAVAAASELVGPDQGIAYVEFHYGRWCPPGAFCALSLPNQGYVIFHTRGLRPDVLVAVKADDAGKVTASDPQQLASPTGS